MTQTSVGAARNALPLPPDLPERIAVPFAAALFLSLTAAFGLDVLPLWARLIYWFALLAMGQVSVLVIRGLVERLKLSLSGAVFGTLVASGLAIVPITALVWFVTSKALSQPLDLARLPAFAAPVAVIMAAMVAISFLVHRRPRETHAGDLAAVGPGETQTPPIVARLPVKLKSAEIHAIQAEDHYVRVHTSAGSDLVLMRFSDAIDALVGIEGAQVHRSWWVARGAVSGSCREQGRTHLLLASGAKAPVSRSYARALRLEGWF